MTKFALTLLIAAAAFGNALGQRKPQPSRVLLNANKPGVYIAFLHAAKIEPLETGVSDQYLWFRITNNTRWPIWLEMNGVPKAYGDAGLFYTIEDPDKIRLDARCHVCSKPGWIWTLNCLLNPERPRPSGCIHANQ